MSLLISFQRERPDVSAEERAEVRRYGMSIDWSSEDEAFIASFPDVPFVRVHGATREEAAERGEEVIVAWLTALRDAGFPIPPPSITARTATLASPPSHDAAAVRRIRRTLDVSQQVFASLLNVKVTTVRSWEQGRRIPDGASTRLLDLAEKRPQVLLELSGMHRKERGA